MAKHSEMEMNSIKQVMERYTEKLIAMSGVIGVGIGETNDSRLCIRVLVSKKNSELPIEIEGYPVDVVRTGPIKAL
jgi:hypothetical protein